MEIDVLLFGPAVQAAGADRVTVHLTRDRTVGGLRAALAQQHAALRPLLAWGRLAVNHSYVRDEHAVVGADDEVALIALVSGG